MKYRSNYTCSHGHAVSVPDSARQPSCCPVFRNGSPCDGGITKLPATSVTLHTLFGVALLGAKA